MKPLRLLLAMLFVAFGTEAQTVSRFVATQMEAYPQLRLLDLYKSCFQDYMGAEHLVADREAARTYLQQELQATAATDLLPWRYEPCGVEGRYVRVSLRVVMEGAVSADALLDAFVRSANAHPRPQQSAWREQWAAMVSQIDTMHLSLPHYVQDRCFIDSLLAVGRYAISHSPDYREAYRPHYRIVERCIFEQELKPLIDAYVRRHDEQAPSASH